jgi:hypothetical protein
MTLPMFIIPGLDPIDDPAATPWLARAADQALAFAGELYGERPRSHASVALAIHLAASVLWRTTDGKPCWSKLDPDVLNRELEEVPAWRHANADVFVTYYAFFAFLAKHGHLSFDAALRAQDRFLPWVSPAFERVMRAITPLASREWTDRFC